MVYFFEEKNMQEIIKLDLQVDKRVEEAINKAMEIYLYKLKNNFLEIGLENTFK